MEQALSKRTRDVALKDLLEVLRSELFVDTREGVQKRVYALIDMGRTQGELRTRVDKKLKRTALSAPLLHGPRYAEAIKSQLVPLLAWGWGQGEQAAGWSRDDVLYSWNRADMAFLDEWAEENGDVISAWLVSRFSPRELTEHLRKAIFVNDMVDGTPYLLRYYDPLITPVLHRVADKAWVEWLFAPILSWWYPVATPREERWSCIAGGGEKLPEEAVPLPLTEELLEALNNDPFPYRLLNKAEQKCPSAFESDCYGVRLAKIEELLASGKEQKLKKEKSLELYVLTLLENPDIVKDVRWQAAVKKAAAGIEPLKNYFEPPAERIENV